MENESHPDEDLAPQLAEQEDVGRWMGLALAGIALHQIHSARVEPGERLFRTTILGLETGLAIWASLHLSPGARRTRGAVWTLLALGPIGGAVIGHLLPITRGRPIPPATESAPLNIAGGALMLTLGLREFRRGSHELQRG